MTPHLTTMSDFLLFQKTLQILVYLKEFTTFFADFFGHVTCIKESEIEIFICALIFRHAIIQRTKLMHFKYEVLNKHQHVMHLQEKPETKEAPDFVKKSMKFVRKFYNECFQRCGPEIYATKSHHLDEKPLQLFVRRLEQLYSQEKDKKSLEKPSKKTFLEETTEANEYQALLMKIVASHTKKRMDLKEIFKKFAQEVKTNEKFHTRPTAINNCFEQKFSCLFSNLSNFDHSCRPNTILM